tara:strand:+ start:925 stop:1602 length:678 start_codon:yes stop_codon:yes gene_type:complete
MRVAILIYFILFKIVSFSQESELLKRVVNKINQIEDYMVDVKISADIPMINILPSKAKIYFKKNDKFKIKSKGIVILPKQGLNDLNNFITKKNDYISIDGTNEKIRDIKTKLITLIPKKNDDDIILAKIWVDLDKELILKTILTNRSSGTVEINYYYDDNSKYPLPKKIKLKIDVKEFIIPKSFGTDINNKKSNNKKDTRKKGTIIINFNNYKINSGLPDNLFID